MALLVGGPLVALTAGDWLDSAASLVFVAASVTLFVASSLLHAVRAGPRLELRLMRFDHAAIFLLIAGTYTPVLVTALRPEHPRLAWTLLAIVWSLAAAGVLFKLLWISAPRWLSTGLYVLMGWLALGAIGPVARSLGATTLGWMVAGGVIYTVGAVVFALERPNLRPGFGYHELWHVLVLLGWACHLVMVARIALA